MITDMFKMNCVDIIINEIGETYEGYYGDDLLSLEEVGVDSEMEWEGEYD